MDASGISFNLAFPGKGFPKLFISWLRKTTIRPQVKEGIAEKGGLRFDLVWGPVVRPIPKFWLPGFWFKRDQGYNPNHQNCYWFVLRIPFVVGFFLSLGLGWGERQPGFYIGLKSYRVDWSSTGLKDNYGRFVVVDGKVPLTWPKEGDLNKVYLCPSASLRSDLVE
jgi:hypothetical protein